MKYFNKVLNWFKSKFFNKELEIAIVGLQNAGKSTLVKAMIDETFDEDTMPTIGFNKHEVKKGIIGVYDRKSLHEAMGSGWSD